MSLAATEARLRRAARTVGVLVRKSRCRTPAHPDFGGYMLVDADTNFVLDGGEPCAFGMSLADVEAALTPDEDGLVQGRQPRGGC